MTRLLLLGTGYQLIWQLLCKRISLGHLLEHENARLFLGIGRFQMKF